MGKTPVIVLLRACMTTAQKYTVGLFGASFSAIREMEDTKSDKGTGVPVTIQASGWKLPEGQDAPADTEMYPYFYDLKADGVTVLDRASITIAKGSLEDAALCGFCPTCETSNGNIRLWSAGVPEKDITAEYWIEQGAEIAAQSSEEGNE